MYGLMGGLVYWWMGWWIGEFGGVVDGLEGWRMDRWMDQGDGG